MLNKDPKEERNFEDGHRIGREWFEIVTKKDISIQRPGEKERGKQKEDDKVEDEEQCNG